MKHLLAKIVHIITAPIWIVGFKFFIGYEIAWENKRIKYQKKRKSTLIISNHLTWVDPFMISMFFPITNPILPFRMIAARKLFFIPIIGQVIWAYGAIKLKKNVSMEKNLDGALNILKNNGTVGIFLEGKRRYTEKPLRPKRGAAYLVLKNNPRIIPIYIDNAFKLSFYEVLLRKRKIRIFVGEEFKIPKPLLSGKNLDEISEYLMKRINNLKK